MVHRFFFLFATVFNLVTTGLAGSQEPADGPWAIVDVQVITMLSDQILKNQTVLIQGDRILAIGSSTDMDIPEGFQRVDGSDQYLVPGLADMHVHTWSLDDQWLFLANGVTTVRNMFGSVLHLNWKSRLEKNEWMGPSLYTAGPIVDGDPPVWPGSRKVVNAEQATQAVENHVERGFDFVKVYARLTQESYAAIVQAASEASLPVMGHVPQAVGLEKVLKSGQRTLEHLDGYATWLEKEDSPFKGKNEFFDRVLAWMHMDEDKIPSIVAMTKEAGIYICPTLVVFDQWGRVEEAKQPTMRFVSPQTMTWWKNSSARATEEFLSGSLESKPFRLKFVKQLHDGGVPILLGTDMGNPYVVAGFSIHQELQNLVAAGLTPYEALQTGTTRAASCMKAESEFGKVSTGMRADLLLLSGNPLQSVDNLKKLESVFIRGRRLTKQQLQDGLDKLSKRYYPTGYEPQ